MPSYFINHMQLGRGRRNGPIRTRSWFVFVSWIHRPFQVVFVSQGQNLIFTIVSGHISLCYFSCAFYWSCLCRYLSQQITSSPAFWLEFRFSAHFDYFAQCLWIRDVFFTTLSENGVPPRQAVGTFDVCLVRAKVCPTDNVRPHAAQLMIDNCRPILPK